MSKKISFTVTASTFCKIFLLLFSTFLIIQSCSKQDLEEELSISGKVTSAITGEPIDSIEVNYYTLQKVHVLRTYTDSTGMYYLNFDLPWKGIIDFQDKDSTRCLHYMSKDTTVAVSLETKRVTMNMVLDTL